jgi:ankyrin repeat protein
MKGKKKSGKSSAGKMQTQNTATRASEQLHATADDSTLLISGASNNLLVELEKLLIGVANGLSAEQLLPWTLKVIEVLNLSDDKGSNVKEIIQNYFLPIHPDKWADLLPRMVSAGYAAEIFQLLMHGVDFARALPEGSNERKFFGTITLLSSMAIANKSEQWSKLLCGAFATAALVHPNLHRVLFRYVYRADQLGWATNILVMVFENRLAEVKALIDLGVEFDAVVSATAEGTTPLHEVKSIEMLDMLVARTPEAIFLKNNKGLLPAHYCVYSKNLDLVKEFVQRSLGSKGSQGKFEMLVGGVAFYSESHPRESLLGFLALQYNRLSTGISEEWLEFFAQCCEFISSYKAVNSPQAIEQHQNVCVVMSKACEHIQNPTSKEHVISRIRAVSPDGSALAVMPDSTEASGDAISLNYRQLLKEFCEWEGDVEATVVAWAQKFTQVFDAAVGEKINTKTTLLEHPMDGPEVWGERLRALVVGEHTAEIFQLLLHGVDFARAFPEASNEHKFFTTINQLCTMGDIAEPDKWAKLLISTFKIAKRISPKYEEILFGYINKPSSHGWSHKIAFLVFRDDRKQVKYLLDLGVKCAEVISDYFQGGTPLHTVKSIEMLNLLVPVESEAIFIKNKIGLLPVHCYAMSKMLDLVKQSVQLSFNGRGVQGKFDMLVGSEASYGQGGAKESLLGFLARRYNDLEKDAKKEWFDFFISCCEFLASHKVAEVSQTLTQTAVDAAMNKACEHIQDEKSKKKAMSCIRAARPTISATIGDAISGEYRQSLENFSGWQGEIKSTAVDWAKAFIRIFDVASKEHVIAKKTLLEHSLDGPENWGLRLHALVAERHSNEIFQLLLHGVDFSKVKTFPKLEKMFFVQVNLLSAMQIEGATVKWAASLLKAFATATKLGEAFRDILFNYIYHSPEKGWAHKLVLLVNDAESPGSDAVAQVAALMAIGVKFELIKSDKVNGATPLHYVKSVEWFDVLFRGDNVSHIFVEDADGLLPVYYSVQHEKLALMQKFLEVADQQPGEKNKLTMLTAKGKNDATLLDYIAQYAFKLEWEETKIWLEFLISCCEFIKGDVTQENEADGISAIRSAREQIVDNASILYLHKRFSELDASAEAVVEETQSEQEAALTVDVKERSAHQACIDGGVDALKDRLIGSYIARYASAEDGNEFLEKMRKVYSSLGFELLQYALGLEPSSQINQIVTLLSNVQNFEKMIIRLSSDDIFESWLETLLAALRLADREFPQLKVWLLDKFYGDSVPLWSNYLLSLVINAKPAAVSRLIAAAVDFSKVASAEMKGATPLHMVSDKESLELLLDQSTDNLLVQNAHGQFPVHVCLRLNDTNLIEMFLGAAAKAGPVLLSTMLTHKVDGKTLGELVGVKRAEVLAAKQSGAILAWGLLARHIASAQERANNVLIGRFMNVSIVPNNGEVSQAVVDIPVAVATNVSNTNNSKSGKKDSAPVAVGHPPIIGRMQEASSIRSPEVAREIAAFSADKANVACSVAPDLIGDPASQEPEVAQGVAALASDASVATLTDANQHQVGEKAVSEGATDGESRGSENTEESDGAPDWSAYIQHIADKGVRVTKKGNINLPKNHMKLFIHHHENGHSLVHCAINVDSSTTDYKQREEGYQGKSGYQALQLIARRYIGLLLPKADEANGFIPPLHYACGMSNPAAVEVLLSVIATNKQADLMMRTVLGAFDASGMTARDYANELPGGEPKETILKHLDNASEFCEQTVWSSVSPKKTTPEKPLLDNGYSAEVKAARSAPETKPIENGRTVKADNGSQRQATNGRNGEHKKSGQAGHSNGSSVAGNPNSTWTSGSKRKNASQQIKNGSAASVKEPTPWKDKLTDGKSKVGAAAVASNPHNAWAVEKAGELKANGVQRHLADYPALK